MRAPSGIRTTAAADAAAGGQGMCGYGTRSQTHRTRDVNTFLALASQDARVDGQPHPTSVSPMETIPTSSGCESRDMKAILNWSLCHSSIRLIHLSNYSDS
jgi:hypothetical protein